MRGAGGLERLRRSPLTLPSSAQDGATNNSLRQACADGNYETVIALLSQTGAEIESPDKVCPYLLSRPHGFDLNVFL
jgi:hypothetical protein